MLELVSFGRFLPSAIQHPAAFDFSLAIAVSGWIEQTLRDIALQRLPFANVVQAAMDFDKVIALTSGIGMNAIWTALTTRPPADVDGSRIAQLEDADRRLRHSLSDPSTHGQRSLIMLRV